MSEKKNLRAVILAVAALILAAALFGLLYHFDNKYNTSVEISQDGAVQLPHLQNLDSSDSDTAYLVHGWKFYPDEIIYPGDEGEKAVEIYIGQHSSFSGLNSDSSPYGTGTYSLTISGRGTYTMLIPEVFSACAVYVDGEMVISSGSISPYKPYIKDLVFSFEADDEAEILIQTANYSGYYSGITYPPAIGSSQAINRLINLRTLFYGFLVFTSLCLSIFTAVIWYGTRKERHSGENFYLGLMALSFSLWVCYPFVHTLGLSGGNIPYILESAASALCLFCIARAVCLTCLKKGSLPDRIIAGVTGGFVITSLVFTIWMVKYLPDFVPVYGKIIYYYKAALAIAMTVLLIRRFIMEKSGHIIFLLTGLLIYCISLIYHAIYLGRYEPAYTGWFEEWGTFILILCFAVRMALENMEIIRENRHLNQHLQEEVQQKTQSLSKLLEERRMLLSGFAHDLKTPLTSITTFTRLVELDNTQLDDESRHYLNIIRRKTKEIQEQLSSINEFTQIDSTPPAFEVLDLVPLVRDFYFGNKPDINVGGISFELLINGDRPVMVYGDRRKLLSVLQNLVFNALNYTPESGEIRLGLETAQNYALIRVEDTGSGISREDLPRIFDRLFTNKAKENSNGMGLFIVKSIITEHGGAIDVSSAVGKGTAFTIKLPLMK